MAIKVEDVDEDWRVRLADGEYELPFSELRSWIGSRRVQGETLVRTPTTKRWKRADNAAELNSAFAELREREWQRREAIERPLREARQRRHKQLVLIGFALFLGSIPLGLVIGEAAGGFLGLIGSVVGFGILAYAAFTHRP